MADIQILRDILEGKIRPKADSVRHIRKIDDDDENIRVAWTAEYMAAYCNICQQLDAMPPAEVGALTKADIADMVWTEMLKLEWIWRGQNEAKE